LKSVEWRSLRRLKNFSQKVESLWNENAILNEKCDTWVVQLIGCWREMVRLWTLWRKSVPLLRRNWTYRISTSMHRA